MSALLLLIPTLLFAYFVQRPETPYWVFILVAATAGFGGGNFASSMANINFFYPARKKGTALGLNAAGGNVGVALIQFFLPLLVVAVRVTERPGAAMAVMALFFARQVFLAAIIPWLLRLTPSTCSVPGTSTPASP